MLVRKVVKVPLGDPYIQVLPYLKTEFFVLRGGRIYPTKYC